MSLFAGARIIFIERMLRNDQIELIVNIIRCKYLKLNIAIILPPAGHPESCGGLK